MIDVAAMDFSSDGPSNVQARDEVLITSDDSSNIILIDRKSKQKVASIEELLKVLKNKPHFVKIDKGCPQAFTKEILDVHFLIKLSLANYKLPPDLDSNFQFGHMINLTSLILDNTNLRHLHPSIGQLQNLQVLSLRNNRLYDLPITLRLLKHLSHLDITGNLFRSLPGTIFHLLNLKILDGLNDNLLEQNPSWSHDNYWIISIPPLKKSRRAQENVCSLQSISLKHAVGLNFWLISLPDQYRNQLVDKTVYFDLCEACMSPVRRIMANQETDGFLIKVCLVLFCGTRNVPFKFLTCSTICREKVISKFQVLQQQYTDELSSRDSLPEVKLKDQHCKPCGKDSSQSDVKEEETPNSGNNTSGNKCLLS